MSLMTQTRIPKTITFLLIFFIAVSSSENSTMNANTTTFDAEKLADVKCGSCPCVNPCTQQPPPSPPPPKTAYCSPVVIMPPPPPRFVYVTSLPEQPYQANVIPSNNWHYFYSSAPTNMVLLINLLFFSGFPLLQLLVLA